MSVKMKFGSKDIPFVYKGDKLIYPNPIKDGLLLWYDFKGMRNTDTNKEVAKDLSGNGNDGTLTNFNFTEESGYKDNTLVFDGVDDKLIIPELELDETAMSVGIDGKAYVYDGDKVVSIDKDNSILATNKNLYGEHINIEKDQAEGATTLVRNHPDAPFGFYTVGARGNVSFVQLNNIFPQSGIYTVSWELGGDQNTATQNAISTHEGVASEIFVNPSTSNETKKFSYTFEVTDISTQNWLRFDRLSWLWYYFKYIDVRMVSQPVEFSPNPSDLQKTTLAPNHLNSLKIYNKPLLKDELLHNAESKGLKKLKPGVVVQDGLVLHYDFSHESNNSEYKEKAFDYSGNGNHGTLSNFAYAEGSGYQDGGLKFDGVDDEIRLQNSWEDTGKITVETVFDSPAGNTTILGASHANFEIATFGTSTLVFYYSDGIASNYRQTQLTLGSTKTNLITTIFHKDLDSVEVFVNGVKRHSYTNPNPQNMTGFNGNSFIIGSRQRARFFAGEMFSSRIYKRALTDEEIQHNYEVEKANFGLQ